MRTYYATLTSKGQLTLPVELRRLWGLKPGDQVEFYEDQEGELLVRPRNAAPSAFLDVLPARKRRRGIKSDDDAIAAAVNERNRRGRSLTAAE
jgi:AbrB family looped-hinge helix DNA binding protein